MILYWVYNLKMKFEKKAGECTPSIKTCLFWFRRIKNGDFETEGKESPGYLKKFENEELEALLDKDSC